MRPLVLEELRGIEGIVGRRVVEAGLRWRTRRGHRERGRREPEVIEDLGGHVVVGDERQDPDVVTAAGARGDLVAENSAQQLSPI